MEKKNLFKVFSLILCVVLIAVTVLVAVGCQRKTLKDDETIVSEVLGTGSVRFYFTAIDKSGNSKKFEIHTDKEFVGDALQELELISGEEQEPGLYIKVVNGIEADYDKDGTYWAFYINGEYAMNGIDSTKIEPDSTYTLKVEK